MLSAAEPASEAECIRVLQSEASLMEKDAACARLKLVGTARCVPALAALLTDEQLSHSARYALEEMSAPEAGASLIEALNKTAGLTRAGIISSLGIRREAGAVPALDKFLGDGDTNVAVASAIALGEIANAEAMAALQSRLATSAGPLHKAVVDALLRCANRLLAGGDSARARATFQTLYDSQPEASIRVAAYRGLLLAAGDQAVGLATGAIAGGESPARTAALQLVPELKAPGATAAFADLLAKVDPSTQVALVEGLGQRKDPAAARAVAALVNSHAPEVRVAALRVLGGLGDASQVAVLANAAASGTGAEKAAARESLADLHRGEPAQALLAQLSDAQPAVQAEAARALGARGDRVAIPELLALARQGTEPAAKAAVEALALLVDQGQLELLVKLVADAGGTEARRRAAEALNSACQHIESMRGRVDIRPLMAGLAGGSPEVRIVLLPICGGFKTPEVRAALRDAIADPDARVSEAAIRTLCNTTDAELLPDLLKLACRAPAENLRTLAIGGCVRLATEEESLKLSNARRVEVLQTILAANPNIDQKRLVLAGLAQVPDPAALTLVEPMLGEDGVQAEAGRAVVKIAPALPDSAMAITALKKVLEKVQDTGTQQAANAALKEIQARAGFINRWEVAGPYRQEGKDYAALFDTVFPPETADAHDVKWRILAAADARSPGVVDLLAALGGQQCVAYARVWVRSDRQQDARLELGSDDGVKVWLNQTLVHANNTARPIQPGSDRADVTLKAGWNTLLLKVTQNNQGWAFCVRLLQADGTPLEGVNFQAEDPAPR